MTTCAICLNNVRETRSNVPIRCGHLFHSRCLDKWKTQGKHTCPVCRKIFDGSKYKVQLTVHNIERDTSNVIDVESNFSLDILDVFFDVQNMHDLDSLLADFGMGVSDLDTLVLDTE